MIVSESEAFWLALVYERVVQCNSMRQPPASTAGPAVETDCPGVNVSDELAPPAPPIDATEISSHKTQLEGADVYEAIRDLAAAFGIARPLEIETLPIGEELNVRCPDDTRWGIFSAQVLSNKEFQHLEVQLSSRLSAAAELLAADEDDDLSWRVLRERLARYAPHFVLGFTQSAPTILLTVGSNGTPRAFATVATRDKGLYRSLLEILINSIPLPAIERLALADLTRFDRVLATAWVPSLTGLHKPIGGFDRDEVHRLFEHFKKGNQTGTGWRIATRFCALERDLQFFIWDLEEHARWSYSCDENETPQAISADAEDVGPAAADRMPAADAGNAGNFTSIALPHEDKASTFAQHLVHLFDQICAEAEREALGPPASSSLPPEPDEEDQYSEPETDPWDLITSRDTILCDFRAEAEDLADCCREHGLPGVAEMVLAARSLIPDSGNPLESWTQSLRASVSDRIAEQLQEAIKRLGDARRVTYGELRLKALKWDEHTLPPPALPGWSRQNANIREAIKVAIDQLNNGLRPYIVMSDKATPLL